MRPKLFSWRFNYLMRVLHVLPSNKISGAENVVADIIAMFRGEIEMVYTSPRGTIEEALKDREITYLEIESFDIGHLKKIVDFVKPDIIHTHDFKASILVAMSEKDIPIVSQIHVNSSDLTKVNLKTLLYRMCSRRFSKVITVSSSIMENYIFRDSIKNKTTLLPNVLYKPRVEKLISKDLQDYDFDFIYVGRLAYQKNPERIANVASLVLKNIPESKFGVVGEGELKARMIEIFEDEGVIDRVTFTGNLPYPYKALKSSKALLMCSRFEGTPITALEAMSLGVPVVSTPVDGMTNIMPNSTLFSDDDIKLAKNVTDLINSNKFHSKHSMLVENEFNELNNIDQYKKILTEIYEQIL